MWSCPTYLCNMNMYIVGETETNNLNKKLTTNARDITKADREKWVQPSTRQPLSLARKRRTCRSNNDDGVGQQLEGGRVGQQALQKARRPLSLDQWAQEAGWLCPCVSKYYRKFLYASKLIFPFWLLNNIEICIICEGS